ncbi:MAG: hypothetical protein NZM26_00875 [Patescibacteria group bacterium]|nr:hypothetical protein [Patescibacteria group bacterium]
MSKYYTKTRSTYVNVNHYEQFALGITQADVIACEQSLLGDKVIFNSKAADHDLKIYKQALEEVKNQQHRTNKHPKFINWLSKYLFDQMLKTIKEKIKTLDV